MKNFANQLKDNWLFLALFTGMVIWYANINTRISQAEADIKDLKTVSNEIFELKTDVAVIRTSVEFIKDRVK